jgi:hypothetical protein
VLLAFGVANFFGTSLAGYLVTRSVSLTLTGMALVMSVTAVVLVSFWQSAVAGRCRRGDVGPGVWFDADRLVNVDLPGGAG